MAEDQTLLAHLTLKLASHPENIAVEALGHILSTSPAAVRALEDVLQTGGSEVGKIAQVRTQDSDEEGGRPDLAGRDADGTKRMLIEAKFWAGLTERQPVKYLKHLLKQDQPSVLLFVAPAKRFEPLWNELCRLVKAADLELVPGQTEEANLRSAVVDGKCRLMLTSWATLLDRMASRASTAGESPTESDIQQLRGLADQMDDDAFLPLRPEELGPEFPRRLANFRKLVDDVIDCLEQEGLAERSGNLSNMQTEYGRHLLLSRSGAGTWFGLDYDKWSKVRDTPLWLYLHDGNGGWEGVKPLSEIRDNLKPLGLMSPPELFEEDNKLVIPIYLPVSVEENTVRDAVVERIKEIENLVNPAD